MMRFCSLFFLFLVAIGADAFMPCFVGGGSWCAQYGARYLESSLSERMER